LLLLANPHPQPIRLLAHPLLNCPGLTLQMQTLWLPLPLLLLLLLAATLQLQHPV
jgi:hypothetical protein